ncbi:MAG: FG-GAP repeat protein, partial [Gammaproteobacteria bacterium]|nr:FG-GAP repeat protein [Gammaproteobacteria bacterium]
AVYLFSHFDSSWSQQAYIKASNTGQSNTNIRGDFGSSVALSSDGNTLAVGDYREDFGSTGVNGDQSIRGMNSRDSGAVYLFSRTDSN